MTPDVQIALKKTLGLKFGVPEGANDTHIAIIIHHDEHDEQEIMMRVSHLNTP